MGAFANMMNLGIIVEQQLHDAGVHTPEELKTLGSKEAWLAIQKIDSSACIHRLYALEGAIRGIKKKELPQTVKNDLKNFYLEHKLMF